MSDIGPILYSGVPEVLGSASDAAEEEGASGEYNKADLDR